MTSENKDRSDIIQTIVNSIGDAVVACDLDGKFIFYNPAAGQILGPDVSGEKPDKWAENFGVFLPDQITPFPAEEVPLLLGLKGKETNDVEQFIKNKAKPEGIFISVSGRPLTDQNSKIMGSVIIIRDITKRKKIEEEIRSANALLMTKNIELQADSDTKR